MREPQDTSISGGMLVHMRSGKYAARDESVLEVLSRYFLEVRPLDRCVSSNETDCASE